MARRWRRAKYLSTARKNIDSNSSMHIIGVGSVTDGEFNSLRTNGINRPISVIEIIKEAKAEARSTHVKEIRKYLTPKYLLGIKRL